MAIDTLLINSNGYNRFSAYTNTFVRGILKVPYRYTLPSWMEKIPWVHTVFQYLLNPYEFLAYTGDWSESIVQHSKLSVTSCNLLNSYELALLRQKIESAELIIVMHTAVGDNMHMINQIRTLLQNRKGKLAIFIGNEYDLINEKINFIKSVGANAVCSQLPEETAYWLYESCFPSKIIPLTHALNPAKYNWSLEHKYRQIGFVGAEYPLFIGDIERNDFIREVEKKATSMQLNSTFRVGARKNLARNQWATFLKHTLAIPGAEAGSYFLDKEGAMLSEAKKYMKLFPQTSPDELFKRFFESPRVAVVSGKAISSRHFEPIGTHTCQILLEGNYNKVLVPDEHYISVRKDYSNLSESIVKAIDPEMHARITEKALLHVLNNHTYNHRIDRLINELSFS